MISVRVACAVLVLDDLLAWQEGLLNETGLERLKASPITELIVTDTVPQHPYAPDARITTLSVAELFGEAIRRIHNNESVNSLFAI